MFYLHFSFFRSGWLFRYFHTNCGSTVQSTEDNIMCNASATTISQDSFQNTGLRLSSNLMLVPGILFNKFTFANCPTSAVSYECPHWELGRSFYNTNSMEQIPWDADDAELYSVFLEPEASLQCSEEPSCCAYLEVTSLYNLSQHFYEINFNTRGGTKVMPPFF